MTVALHYIGHCYIQNRELYALWFAQCPLSQQSKHYNKLPHFQKRPEYRSTFNTSDEDIWWIIWREYGTNNWFTRNFLFWGSSHFVNTIWRLESNKLPSLTLQAHDGWGSSRMIGKWILKLQLIYHFLTTQSSIWLIYSIVNEPNLTTFLTRWNIYIKVLAWFMVFFILVSLIAIFLWKINTIESCKYWDIMKYDLLCNASTLPKRISKIFFKMINVNKFCIQRTSFVKNWSWCSYLWFHALNKLILIQMLKIFCEIYDR